MYYTSSGCEMSNCITDDTLNWASSVVDAERPELRTSEKVALFIKDGFFEVFCESHREYVFFKFSFENNICSYRGSDIKRKTAL